MPVELITPNRETISTLKELLRPGLKTLPPSAGSATTPSGDGPAAGAVPVGCPKPEPAAYPLSRVKDGGWADQAGG